MNALEEDVFMQIQGTNQPVVSTDIDRHPSDVKPVLSPTHNGYKSISNHISHKSKQDIPNHIKPMKDTKLLESTPKHHSSSVHNNSTSKHGDHSKHKVHSSSSKHKDSSLIKDPSLKSHSSKTSEMKSKDHHSHDKKHDVLKTKDNIPKSPNEISKKHSSKPKEYKDIKVKKEGDKHGSVDHSSKDAIKDKPKDGSIKEKHKIVISKDKLKESNNRPKEKIKEKSKDSSGTEKRSSGEHKIKQVAKDSSSIEKKSPGEHKIKLEVIKKADGTGDYKGPLLVKLKGEVKSPEKQMKIKDEPLSDEEISLAERERKKESAKQQMKQKKEADDSDDEPLAKRMKKVKKIKAQTTESNKRKNHDHSDYKPSKKAKLEKNSRSQPDSTSSRKKKNAEEEVEVWKWWEEEKLDDGVKWKTLQHNGPVFAPPYEPLPKNVKFFYNGKHMELSSETEEVAGFYARMLDHDYVTKDIFNKNFFTDWHKVMTPEEKALITDLSKCNFSQINDYYKLKSEERKNRTKEEKLELKKQNEELQQKYGFCIIDGHKQKIGNFKIEPPGLFRGRGEHPKMGMLKRRICPEDIIINIGKEATVPEPPEGHKWKKVKHENTVTWLACWSENILGQTKYIMLNPSSKLKGEKDWQKYETARKLKSRAKGIREQYMKDWKSKEMKVRQRAVALYFIDKLALRAGNEKEEGETADTVGCCSLRVEHIILSEEKDGKQYVVDFDFLGKDSIRYVNSVAVEKRVFKNLKLFMENKQPGDDLFDRLNTAILNKHLNELMEGLTAKVFRTYNASKTLQEQLHLLTKEEMSIPEKLLAYNRANRAVAILCNHQRSVPKTFSKQMETLQKKIDEKEAQIKDFKKELKKAKQAYKDSNSSKDKVLYEKKKKRMDQLLEQLKKLEVQATDKEENKQIALGTSKLNYLDPRISAAWCKKWNVPIEKIYNRTQRDKFRWAIEMAGPDFTF